MPSLVNVAIHPSQFPEKVRRDLLDSLRTRAVNHKFHYDSVKQTQKWLALHQACSPSRNDTDCAATYDAAFAAAATEAASEKVHVIGLGCGGGQKDTRLLHLLKERGKEIFYTPCDVSTAMVLTARQTALPVLSSFDVQRSMLSLRSPDKSGFDVQCSRVHEEDRCFPLVCDLASTGDLSAVFSSRHPALVTFFGMIPNFEPEMILPRLASLIGPEDRLLFSANLAPGNDYAAGVKKILPQYDNPLTRDWLLAFLLDLGVETGDGDLHFDIEEVKGLKRIVARFEFQHTRSFAIEDERFEFHPGDSVRLFFSYRYTPALAQALLQKHGLEILGHWITKSEEEGVFLCRRN